VATQIEPDGTMLRRWVDTTGRSDCRHWDVLAARALAVQPPYRPVPGIAVYHISVDGHVVLVAEHDLTAPLVDLIIAVMTLGDEV
jgi:hypothetical protein